MTREGENQPVDGMDYSSRERLAGAFVLVGILLLIGALAFSSQIAFLLADTFTLKAEVSTADGISTEAPVKYAGIEIGRVSDVELMPDGRIALTLKIREKHHELVRADSTAKLNRLAILGDVTINITRGDPQQPPIEDGTVIRVEETSSLDELLSGLAPAVDDIVATADRARAVAESIEPQSVARIAADLEIAAASVRDVVKRVHDGEGAVGRLFNDDQLASDLAANVTQLKDVLALAEMRLRDLEPVLVNTAARTGEMAELLDDTNALVNQISGAVETLESQQGGAVSAVLVEMRSTLDEAEKTLRAIRNTWPFSTSAPEAEPVEAVPPQPPVD